MPYRFRGRNRSREIYFLKTSLFLLNIYASYNGKPILTTALVCTTIDFNNSGMLYFIYHCHQPISSFNRLEPWKDRINHKLGRKTNKIIGCCKKTIHRSDTVQWLWPLWWTQVMTRRLALKISPYEMESYGLLLEPVVSTTDIPLILMESSPWSSPFLLYSWTYLWFGLVLRSLVLKFILKNIVTKLWIVSQLKIPFRKTDVQIFPI